MTARITLMFERDRKAILKLSQTHPLVRLLLRLGWLHEACHYLAARLVGLKVNRVNQAEMYVEAGAVGQLLATLLAPAAVGMLVLALGLSGLVSGPPTQANYSIFGLVVSLSMSWLMGCWLDLRDAGGILKRK